MLKTGYKNFIHFFLFFLIEWWKISSNDLIPGAAGVISCYPLDTVKVRIQTQDVARGKLYRSTLDCMVKIAKKEGWSLNILNNFFHIQFQKRGLYKGMNCPLLGVAGLNTITQTWEKWKIFREQLFVLTNFRKSAWFTSFSNLWQKVIFKIFKPKYNLFRLMFDLNGLIVA